MAAAPLMSSQALFSHHANRACIPAVHNSASKGSDLLRAAVPGAPATLDPPPPKTKAPSVRKSRKPDTAVSAPSRQGTPARQGTPSSAPPPPPQQQEQGVLAENLAAASKVSLMKWKVVDLKAMLAELQQPKSGNKEALVERLLETIQQITEGNCKPVRKPARKPRKLAKADAGGADGGAYSPAQLTLSSAPALGEESSSSSSSNKGRGDWKKKKMMSVESTEEGMLQEHASSRRDVGGEGESTGGGMGSSASRAAPVAAPQEVSDTSSGAGPAQQRRTPGAVQEGEGALSPTQQPSSSRSRKGDGTGNESTGNESTTTRALEKKGAGGKEGIQPPQPQRGPTANGSQPPQPLETPKQGSAKGAEVPLADDSFLPPFPVTPRGKNYGLHESDLPPLQLKTILESNSTDMQLAFLGTAAFKPHRGRALGSMALLRGKDVWIFDAGDDIQRQLGSLPVARPSKVFRIFITRTTPDCLLGLPGLMCTISAARMRGHASADIPVHVYGPKGIAEFLCTVFKVSNTYNEISTLVYECVPHAVTEEERHPTLFNKRARVFRALVPPDALNPQGITKGNLDSFMPNAGRAEMQKGFYSSGGPLSYDPRAGFLPFPDPVPGDPPRSQGALPLESLTWTVQADISARFTMVALPGSTSAEGQGSEQEEHLVFAVIVQEANRLGNLQVDRAQALGVEQGDNYTRLKDGQTVLNAHGQRVTSEMVVTPLKSGRKVAIMGNGAALPASNSAFVQHAMGADVLVSGAVAPPAMGSMGDNQEPPSHGVAHGLQAAAFGQLAARLGVDRLMLARLDMRRLQQVLQQGASAHQLAPAWQPASSAGEKAGWECKDRADEVQHWIWSSQALEAAESVYFQQLQQEALESVAQHGASCNISVPYDFWLHILEKHG